MDWKRINFMFYGMAFVFYGSIITAMGPIIPYYAAQTNMKQTYFSFVFFARAIGYILGGMLFKYLVERFHLHSILIGSIFVGGASFAISTIALNFWNLSIFLAIGGGCCCLIGITCNVCVMKAFRGKQQDFWIQMLHSLFGIGGLIGPFLVAIFGSQCYLILGIVLALTSFCFYFLQSPDGRQSQRKSQIARPINRTSQIIICFLYVLYIGQQVGYGSWVSSFVVMQNVGNLTEAAFASQVFWVTNTAFRIILLYVTIDVSLRLKYLLLGMIGGCFINLVAAMSGHEWFAAYIGSFLNGMFLASMYALFLALPLQFGYKLSKQNTANFMMSASLGQGFLGMPIGYAMGLFGADTLFWTQFIFAVSSFILFKAVLNIFVRESKQTYLVPKLQEIQISNGLIAI